MSTISVLRTGEKGLGGRATGTGTGDVTGETAYETLGQRKRQKMNGEWWDVARLWGLCIHQKGFRLYSVTNRDSWEGF